MKYYTYWSINDVPSQTINPNSILLCVGIICILLSILAFKFDYKINRESKPIKWLLLLICFITFSFYFYSLLFPTKKFDYIRYLEKRKMLYVIEGKILNFKNIHIVKNSGRYSAEWNEESFNVNEIHFSYDDHFPNRFNNFSLTTQNGGTLKNDEQVKITYTKDYHDEYNENVKKKFNILKIERLNK